jgi:5-methylcytosine-specific restriction enzyme A
MPSKPLKPCATIRCSNLTIDRYCEEHKEIQVKYQADRYKHYDRTSRDKKAAAFYNSKEWERTRQQALIRDNGLCLSCLMNKEITMADMVDHIVPIKIAWHLRTNLNNLQSLCNACHRAKTEADKRKYG